MVTDFSYSDRINPEYVTVLRQHQATLPVQVGALAKDLGLRVVLATLPLNISGLIQPDQAGDYVVKVNRFESKERQRFTIAHEIAHYLLHREQISSGVVDSVLYRSKLSSRTEAEANRLAADIVMPAGAVRTIAARLTREDSKNIVARLAEEFGVSKQAMEIRLS